MSLTVQTKLLVVLLLQNVVIRNIFVCVLIKREYFRFFKTSQYVGWNRLNLWKELKKASRILDLGLETTLLKFTQLYLQQLCQ